MTHGTYCHWGTRVLQFRMEVGAKKPGLWERWGVHPCHVGGGGGGGGSLSGAPYQEVVHMFDFYLLLIMASVRPARRRSCRRKLRALRLWGHSGQSSSFAWHLLNDHTRSRDCRVAATLTRMPFFRPPNLGCTPLNHDTWESFRSAHPVPSTVSCTA